MEILNCVSKGIQKVSKFVVIAFTSMIVLIILLQVISRYVFNSPFSWTMELNIFFFEWLVFIGASVALKDKEHVKMDFFVLKFSEKVQKIIELFTTVIIIAFIVILIRNNIKLLPMHSQYRTPVVRIPTSLFNISFTVGCVFMVLHCIQNVLSILIWLQGERR